jgi:hypothetical protein
MDLLGRGRTGCNTLCNTLCNTTLCYTKLCNTLCTVVVVGGGYRIQFKMSFTNIHTVLHTVDTAVVQHYLLCYHVCHPPPVLPLEPLNVCLADAAVLSAGDDGASPRAGRAQGLQKVRPPVTCLPTALHCTAYITAYHCTALHWSLVTPLFTRHAEHSSLPFIPSSRALLGPGSAGQS